MTLIRANKSLRLLLMLAAVTSMVWALVLLPYGIGVAAPDSPTGRIVSAQATGSTLTIVFAATNLPPGQSIDPASVKVVAGNTTLPSTTNALGASGSLAPTAVLAMDVSGSVAGPRLTAAQGAAKAFVATAPESARIGVVAFADNAGVILRPTTDRPTIQRAIDSLTAKGSTALYDGTLLGLRTTGTQGPRSVIVFSDGADTSSRTPLAQAVATIKQGGATVDAVALGNEPTQLATLGALTKAGRGRVISTTDTAALASAFTSAARDLTNQVTIVANIPPALQGSSVNVQVSAAAAGQSVTDAVFLTLPAAPVPTPTALGQPIPVPQPTGIPLGLWAVLIGALLLVGGIAYLILSASRAQASRESRARRVASRLSIYTLSGRAAAERRSDSDGIATTARNLATRAAAARDFDNVLEGRLERAGLPLRPGEWLLIHLGVTLAAGLVLLLLSGGNLLPALVGVALGAAGPFAFLAVREERRRSAFEAQLPDTLQLLSGSLASGLSLPQAVATLSDDAGEPMSGELRRGLAEARLGKSMEDGLEDIAQRMRSTDFSWVVMAIRIQRQVGGNLAEVIATVAATMRERERLRRQVSALSAEGRLSAWILGALPIVFTVFLVLTRPTYLAPLIQTPIGIGMIILAAILMTAGAIWLAKTVKVEV